MRLFTDNAVNYIYALTRSISKDPASLDSWRCLHIHPKEGVAPDLAVINRIKDTNKEMDCDIVVCPDNDILIISRDLNEIDMHNLADALTLNMTMDAPETTLYDLFADWRRIRALLSPKTSGMNAVPKIDIEETANFGETSSMHDVFAAAKKLRTARKPEHVMLVEDDPLTRRIVSGTFKENYAIITACDAHEAISNYLLHAPDIVFLDIGLPGTSGFAVLKQIMATDPDAYVVMFSGNSYLDNVNKALGAGASGFIAKPFKKERLRHYIEDSALHHRKSL